MRAICVEEGGGDGNMKDSSLPPCSEIRRQQQKCMAQICFHRLNCPLQFSVIKNSDLWYVLGITLKFLKAFLLFKVLCLQIIWINNFETLARENSGQVLSKTVWNDFSSADFHQALSFPSTCMSTFSTEMKPMFKWLYKLASSPGCGATSIWLHQTTPVRAVSSPDGFNYSSFGKL